MKKKKQNLRKKKTRTDKDEHIVELLPPFTPEQNADKISLETAQKKPNERHLGSPKSVETLKESSLETILTEYSTQAKNLHDKLMYIFLNSFLNRKLSKHLI